MEGLSAKVLERRARLHGQERRLGAESRPVDLVAQEGVADRRKVDADLVGAAGLG